MAGVVQMGTAFISSSSDFRTSFSFQRSKSIARRKTLTHSKIREIFMPALSSTMTEGKIISWLRSEGDKLSKGESVVVVESDKADMDVETFHEGYLAAIMVEEGGIAAVGSAIALIAETEAEIADVKSRASSLSNSAVHAADEFSGMSDSSESPAESPDLMSPVSSVSIHPASDGGKRIVATPYAKKLANDLKVDLLSVTGSGPLGRVVARDVEAAASISQAQFSLASSPGLVKSSVSPQVNVTTFTSVQDAVSHKTAESLAVPTFSVGYTITTDALHQLYEKIKPKGVTMTALLVKATALALVQHPVVNSSCVDGSSFAFNDSVNIAVTVAIQGGHVTPVLHDVDKADVYSLSRKWKELVDKAYKKQLQPHECSAGTFTLSNLGMLGIDSFDAILPPGTGAIMAVGASRPTVVAAEDGSIGIRRQMQVNATADHRVIYGAELASFLQTLEKIIQVPKNLTF